MKVRLLRDSRIKHKVGEIVEVSPTEALYLLSVGSAVELHDEVKVETPEDVQVVETPEKKRTTRKTKK